MTTYTSGKTTHDPEPWVENFDGKTRVASPVVGGLIGRAEYLPRPEFDNHNPILVWLRAASEDKVLRATYGDGLMPLLASDFLMPGALDGHSDHHLTHAHRVLAKIAALTTNGVTD